MKLQEIFVKYQFIKLPKIFKNNITIRVDFNLLSFLDHPTWEIRERAPPQNHKRISCETGQRTGKKVAKHGSTGIERPDSSGDERHLRRRIEPPAQPKASRLFHRQARRHQTNPDERHLRAGLLGQLELVLRRGNELQARDHNRQFRLELELPRLEALPLDGAAEETGPEERL